LGFFGVFGFFGFFFGFLAILPPPIVLVVIGTVPCPQRTFYAALLYFHIARLSVITQQVFGEHWVNTSLVSGKAPFCSAACLILSEAVSYPKHSPKLYQFITAAETVLWYSVDSSFMGATAIRFE